MECDVQGGPENGVSNGGFFVMARWCTVYREDSRFMRGTGTEVTRKMDIRPYHGSGRSNYLGFRIDSFNYSGGAP